MPTVVATAPPREVVKPPPVVNVAPTPTGDPLAVAQSLAKKGAYAESLPYFSQAIAKAPAYGAYFGRAGAYQRLGRLQEAVADYSEAIRLNSGGAMAHHEQAVCLARLNQDDRALAGYDRAIELAPGYALSWNGRGMIYLHRHEYQKASFDFSEAIRLKPDFYQAYKNRATARKALGDTEGAKADLDQANTLKQ
jgi:tetratricopeptide (TPR) repeat protein